MVKTNYNNKKLKKYKNKTPHTYHLLSLKKKHQFIKATILSYTTFLYEIPAKNVIMQ